VERFHSKKQGKYRSWIIPLQILTAGTMVALANWQFGTSLSIFVLGVALINIFSSVQDVSTDGYAVKILSSKERGWGNAIQVGCYWLGFVVGGGFILMLMNSLGWNFLLIAMALVTLLATIPLLLTRPAKRAQNKKAPQSPNQSIGLLNFLRQPTVFKLLTLVAAFRMLEGFIRSLVPTMFKDWGMELNEIGFTLGIVAPGAALGGALVAGILVTRLGRLHSLLLFGSMQILSAAGYMFLSSTELVDSSLVFPVVVVDHMISGMTTVALFSLMMDWSRKEHGGTDYTCMDCIGVFAMMFGTGISYLIAHYGGYTMSFGCAIPLTLLSLFIVRTLFAQIQKENHWKSLHSNN